MVCHDWDMEVHGTCDDRFSGVRDAFVHNFETGLELGASAAVTVDGEFVVDIWGGDANGDGTPWERDTIVNVWSTTKTMAATCMLMLADRGELDFDAPVARYWPEFAQNGKEGVLVRHVMSHTAGVPGFEPHIRVPEFYDLELAAANLAAQAPWWEPGTRSGYHSTTQGNLTGAILYRITGRRMAEWFQTEVATPLGADFWMSLPASEDHRVADLVPPGAQSIADLADSGIDASDIGPDSVAARVWASRTHSPLEPRTRAWREAELPATGGFGNARSVARIHAMLANGGELDGIRLISEAGARRGLEEQIDNIDLALLVRLRHGLGFGLEMHGPPVSPNPGFMFWGGWGGSLAIIDFDARMSAAYVMNRMDSRLTGDLRANHIMKAAYAAL